MCVFFISHFHNRLINEHVLLVQGEKTFFHLGGKGSMIDVMTRKKKYSRNTRDEKVQVRIKDGFLEDLTAAPKGEE